MEKQFTSFFVINFFLNLVFSFFWMYGLFVLLKLPGVCFGFIYFGLLWNKKFHLKSI